MTTSFLCSEEVGPIELRERFVGLEALLEALGATPREADEGKQAHWLGERGEEGLGGRAMGLTAPVSGGLLHVCAGRGPSARRWGEAGLRYLQPLPQPPATSDSSPRLPVLPTLSQPASHLETPIAPCWVRSSVAEA